MQEYEPSESDVQQMLEMYDQHRLESRATSNGSLYWDGRRLDAMIGDICSDAVKQCGGNLREAARRLGISHTTLYRHLSTRIAEV